MGIFCIIDYFVDFRCATDTIRCGLGIFSSKSTFIEAGIHSRSNRYILNGKCVTPRADIRASANAGFFDARLALMKKVSERKIPEHFFSAGMIILYAPNRPVNFRYPKRKKINQPRENHAHLLRRLFNPEIFNFQDAPHIAMSCQLLNALGWCNFVEEGIALVFVGWHNNGKICRGMRKKLHKMRIIGNSVLDHF